MVDSKIGALSFIVLFWVFLTILSGYFEEDILLGNVQDLNVQTDGETESNFIKGFINSLDSIPIINKFTPLMRIASFQYSDQIPSAISLFLILISVVSGYLVYAMLRGY